MFNWPWWVYSMAAAVVWGIHFNLVVKVASRLPKDIYTPMTLFIFTGLSMFLVFPFVQQKVFSNIITLWSAGNDIRLSMIVLVFTTLIASSLLYIAMQLSPNATVAALLDITYPLFVAIAAWLLFRQNHIDWYVIIGGAFIFIGAMIIIWKHG